MSNTPYQRSEFDNTQNIGLEGSSNSEFQTGASDAIQDPSLLDRSAVIAAVQMGIPEAPEEGPDLLTHLQSERIAKNTPPPHLIEKALENPDLLEDANQVRKLFEYSATQRHIGASERSLGIADKYIDHTTERFGRGSPEVERAIEFKFALREKINTQNQS